MSRVFVVAGLFLVFAQLAPAFKKCDAISDDELADVDEDWYLEQAAKGFYKIEQGNWDHGKNENLWDWARRLGLGRGAGSLKTICYDWDVFIPTGNKVLPMAYNYTNLNNQECKMDFSESAAEGKIEFGGQSKFLKTDNKTYVAGTFCLMNEIATYFIMTTTEEQLDPKIIDSLGKQFKDIGFDKGQTSAKKGITALYLNKFKSTPCP